MRNSLPLIYSGQEEPVLDSISFFYKNPIKFGKYSRAAFYKTLLELRKSSAALATDASFTKVKTGDAKSVYAYTREKNGHKILVILNLSPKPQVIQPDAPDLAGEVINVFTGKKEKIAPGNPLRLEAWGYKVYNYDLK